MRNISVLIIGAGQAGLAMSRCLSDRSVPHVVLERGEVANSWRRERWDSLRLLTPNWQSRLPGFAYRGNDPDGFMSMPEIIGHLDDYAETIAAPVETGTSVLSVRSEGDGYQVSTNRGEWKCSNLVVATGACSIANVPAPASAMPDSITQLTPFEYKTPDQLAAGGVLVVGASATGVQLASEISASGREVTLAAGEHIRMPRYYRGRDIQWWMEYAGIHGTSINEIDDLARARTVPSLQLVGSSRKQFLDLNALQKQGVEITGRVAGIRDSHIQFSGSLANCCSLSDLKMNRLLLTLDAWARETGIEGIEPAVRFDPTAVSKAPRLTASLSDGRFRTVIWATGFRPDFHWLELPVFDQRGRLLHEEGHVAPGLYVLGLPFLRRRNSALIDGVGKDAETLADHIIRNRGLLAA
ncbi:MAG: NAD(P)-binding domain-containing protein [Nitratireductor sp.]|nr:NAD(P)-binding domain-containing protein [Nitratireductor sp.]